MWPSCFPPRKHLVRFDFNPGLTNDVTGFVWKTQSNIAEWGQAATCNVSAGPNQARLAWKPRVRQIQTHYFCCSKNYDCLNHWWIMRLLFQTFFMMCLHHLASYLLFPKVCSWEGPGDLPRHRRQAGHHLSKSGPRQRLRVLQAVSGEEGASGELQHSPRSQRSGQL